VAGTPPTSIPGVSETIVSVSVDVPAKINLLLRVGPARSDGFHDLVTVYQAITLFDRVTARAADELTLQLSGPEATEVTADADNLAWRAAVGLAGHYHLQPTVALTVHKAIPVAAGLAGGSADAAGALVACAKLWGLEPDLTTLAAIAAELGSDVPFSLIGGTAVGTGRGERLQPLAVTQHLWWVVAAARGGLSTPAVYAELDRLRPAAATPDVDAARSTISALETGDPVALAATLRNDLQHPALSLAPDLERTLAAGSQAGALAGLVSGSGPTCVFLASDRAQAQLIRQRLEASGTCRFALIAEGGAPGALATGVA
jgi:4-diphosphocytidyl-2-C-methyl-D-erythritol kinase